MTSLLDGKNALITGGGTGIGRAAVYRDGGWPAAVHGDSISAPYRAQSAGPPPWHLYRLTIHTAFGVGLREPHGASRWRF